MSYLTMEQLAKIAEESKTDNRTSEEIAEMRELGEKVKATSYEERRAIRQKLDEEDGYC